jgi:two-component system sensor histidine kinase BaeS
MKIRLFYKIYALSLVAVVASMLIMILMVGYFGYFNFREYLIKTKMQELTWLADKLGEYYAQHGSFKNIKDMAAHPDKAMMIPPPPPEPDGKNMDKREPGKEIEQLKRTFLTKDNKLDIASLYHFRHFITLLDKERTIILGKAIPNSEFVFIPVVSNNKEVGYLGIRKPPQVTHPLAIGFLRQQLSLMVFSAIMIIVLTGVLSWVFAKKLLAPVPMLINATRKLASRDFEVDIQQMSNDELGELAMDFRKMAYDLSMYEKKQNRWISDISHELRTPLSVLLGNIEAMQDGVRKTDGETLNILHGEVSRLIKLVNELHEMTMAESDNMHFTFAPVSMDRIAEDVVELYKSRAEEFGFQIRTMIRASGVTVMGDVSRLRQVFINVIENSLRHSKSPGVIFISCLPKDTGVTVTLEDTGPGVTEDQLGMLFDRLYRSDSSRNRETGGSGLGLAICKYIVEKHGGTISAVSGSMGGLRIEIYLPGETNE